MGKATTSITRVSPYQSGIQSGNMSTKLTLKKCNVSLQFKFMKFIRQILFYLILVVATINLSSFSIHEMLLPKEVTDALKSGDAQNLSLFFNHHIELVVVGKSDVYSKYQSQIILRNFFRANPPSNFSLLQRGMNGKVSFAIGRLFTSNGKFKVYLLGKGSGSNYRIHQLRIEKDYG